MDRVTPHASKCRVATAHDTVNNSECVYTFHNPFTTESGILVDLKSFVGTIDSMAFGGVASTESTSGDQQALFVRIVKNRVAKEAREGGGGSNEDVKMSSESSKSEETSGLEAKVTKLGMGVEGGFQSPDDTFEIVSKYSVVLLQNEPGGKVSIVIELPFTDTTKNEFPMNVTASVESIIHHAGAAVQQDLKAWELDDEKIVSKYAESLEFVDNGVKISPNPSDWKVCGERCFFYIFMICLQFIRQT